MGSFRWLFIVGVFLLGMPLDGVIPQPAGQFRDATQDVRYVEASGRALMVGAIWSIIYFSAAFAVLRNRRIAKGIWSGHLWFSFAVFAVAVSGFWTVQPTRAVIDALQILGSGIFALAAAIYYFRRADVFLSDAASSLGLNQAVNVVAVLLLPSDTLHDDGRWAGVTGSANYLGILAAATLWAAVCAISDASPWRKLWLFFATGVAINNLLMSGSATAAVFAVAAIGMYGVAAWILNTTRAGSVRLLLVVVAAASIATVGLVVGVTVLWEGFTGLVGKDAHLSGRTAIWIGGVSAFLERPWLGHGFGVDTESLGVTHWSTTFHSGYLEVAVKGGVFGLLILLLMGLKVVHELWASLDRRDAVAAAPIAFILAAFLYNVSETGWFAARNPVWVIFLAVLFLLSARRIYRSALGARPGLLLDVAEFGDGIVSGSSPKHVQGITRRDGRAHPDGT